MHITELAQTCHIGIGVGVDMVLVLFKLLSFLSFRGGGVPLNSQIYTEICSNFVIF